MKQTDFIQIGQQKGYIQILDQGTTIHYIAPDKRYRFTDPEEQVRASYYVELIERYQYPETRINLGGTVPRRTPSNFADIVFFDDRAHIGQNINEHLAGSITKDAVTSV